MVRGTNFRLSIILLLLCGIALPSIPATVQDSWPPTRKGFSKPYLVYRPLADLWYKTVRRGDNDEALNYVLLLQHAWEISSDSLNQRSPDVWEKIDHSMGECIEAGQTHTPDPKKALIAYRSLVSALDSAESAGKF